MRFWWFILFFDVLIPVMMIALGRIMWKHPPKKINGIMGYRTNRSMQNMDTWNFAHTHSGKLWWILGWVTLLPSLIVHIPFYNGTAGEIGIVSIILISIQIIVLIGSIFATERALKNTFSKEGIRR